METFNYTAVSSVRSKYKHKNAIKYLINKCNNEVHFWPSGLDHSSDRMISLDSIDRNTAKECFYWKVTNLYSLSNPNYHRLVSIEK